MLKRKEKEQMGILEAAFEKNPKWDNEKYIELSVITNLSIN